MLAAISGLSAQNASSNVHISRGDLQILHHDPHLRTHEEAHLSNPSHEMAWQTWFHCSVPLPPS